MFRWITIITLMLGLVARSTQAQDDVLAAAK